MMIRMANEAKLLDSAPEPVHLKMNNHDGPIETMVSQNQEADPALDALTYVVRATLHPVLPG